MDLRNLREKQHRLLAHMKESNYAESYVHQTEMMIKHILTFHANPSVQTYTDVYLDFVKQDKTHSTLKTYRTFIGIIKNFDELGAYPNRINRQTVWLTSNYHTLLPVFRKIVDVYKVEASRRGLKATTAQGEARNAASFLAFIQRAGATNLAEISHEMVIAYFTDGNGCPNKSYSLKKQIVSVFKTISHLYPDSERVLLYLPKLKKRRRNIPYLTDSESAAIKSVLIDPDSPLSLRDRAIGLLAYETGLRCCDIAGLMLSSIDWERELITIIQQKTNCPQELKLPPRCGNAIYDYILNERQETDDRKIFVRTIPPYIRLQSRSLTAVATRIAQAANVRQNTGDRRGFHLYRHRLATTLLENDISDVVISKVLGHNSPESLEIYLGADFVHLKKNALSIETFPADLGGVVQ